MPITTDYLVIGSGVAGLSFALEASETGDVVIVTKRSADESNTKYAQGGIAAVLGEGDSFAAHIEDTLRAGAGLCHDRAVEVCVKEGPARPHENQYVAGTNFSGKLRRVIDHALAGLIGDELGDFLRDALRNQARRIRLVQKVERQPPVARVLPRLRPDGWPDFDEARKPVL